LKWLINILLCSISLIAFAQKDTTHLSFKTYYVPTGVRISTDLISFSRNFYDDSFSGWEANVDVDFYRYYLTIDYGNWARSYENEQLKYSNDGNYFRAGVDVNFLTKDAQRNMFFLGLRYGHSTFNENFHVEDVDYDGNPRIDDYLNANIPAQWYELTTGVKVKLWSFLWMGYTARFKFGLKTGDTPQMAPHDVPGYGRTDKDSDWGFNYQLMFRIPVRKMPPLPAPRKKKK
jgi:hypothetical protein